MAPTFSLSKLKNMNQTITLAEAILVSITTVLVWAFIKTILEYIDEAAKKRELPPKKFDNRPIAKYHKDLWYGDESQDEVLRMLEEVLYGK